MERYEVTGGRELTSMAARTRATSRELAAGAWSAYFASIAPLGERVLASVAVTGDDGAGDHGDGRQDDRRRPLRSISYDAEHDVLELAVGSDGAPEPVLRYFISAPRRIDVARTDDITSIVVDDATGARTRIYLYRLPRLRAVPDLFAPPAAASSPHSRNGHRQ